MNAPRFLIPLLMIVVTLFAIAAPTPASEFSSTNQIVIDNSPAMMGKSSAEIAQRQLLYWTWKLKRRPATRRTVVGIVSTVNAQTRWQGTPRDLGRDGAAAAGALRIIDKGCPNLLGALDQVRINLTLLRPKQAHVIIFSSLIHAFPCANQTIKLPQAVPPNLDLSFLKRDGIRVTFLWVHPLQKSGWLAALQKAGLRNFRLLDPAATKALLKQRGGPYRD